MGKKGNGAGGECSKAQRIATKTRREVMQGRLSEMVKRPMMRMRMQKGKK